MTARPDHTNTMERWETNTGPCLHVLRTSAEWMRHFAKDMQRAADILGERPDFVTHAEAELDALETELKTALKSVRDAKAKFKSRPVFKTLIAAE